MLRYYDPDSDDEETATYPFNQPRIYHSGGVLFQQWVCYAYSRAEAQRLARVTMNQDQLRADTYQGLVGAVNIPAFVSGVSKVGKLSYCLLRILARHGQCSKTSWTR